MTVIVAAAVAAAVLLTDILSAQTALTITSSARVQDTTIRGGSYAAINFSSDWLVTRASSDPTYARRTLLDIDTSSTIPAGSAIQSATLTLTVHWGGADASRRVGVFPVTRAFMASQATWDVASPTAPWSNSGGDFGPQAASADVPNGQGQKVHFDVTALVQANVLSSGSRRTRIALVDTDSLTTAREGYREYYSTESATSSYRPVLSIVYGGSTETASRVPNFSHIFTIVMENREYSSIIGSPSAPYINSLANKYGLATNYTAVTHPSLPNYMALTGGKTAFTTDCAGCITSADDIADQVYDSGRTWKAYFESMPAACTTVDSGRYLQRHNPFIHYQDIVGDATRCRNHVVPLTQFSNELSAGTLPHYVWITPNSCHDMHDCSVSTGDAWLSSFLPTILNSSSFANSALFLVWDEGTSSTGGGGRIPLIVISPRTPAGYRSAAAYNHYNLLRTIEAAWGMPALGHASGTTPLAEFFK